MAEKNFSWVGYLPALSKFDADYVVNAGYVPENLRACIPTQEEIDKALYLRPLDADGQAKYEKVYSAFTSGA